MARYNERGDVVSDDGHWLWVGGSLFDFRLEQWQRIPERGETVAKAGRKYIGEDGPRKPGRRETREAARLALQASEEWKRMEQMKADAQAEIERLSPQYPPPAGETA